MTVISASRRTDIPAFYPEWFMNRIREGYVRWMNPFSKAIYQVSLEPDDVSAIVFWSKNYLPLVPHLDELDVRGWPMWNCLGRSRQRNWTHNQQSSSG